MSENYHPVDADVIVIGAGVSGLTVALTLLQKEASLNILVVEDRDMNNLHDVGAHWISSQQTSFFELMNELGIRISVDNPKQGKVMIDYNEKVFIGSRQQPFGFCGIGEKLELASFVNKIEVLCRARSLDPALTSMTMETFINLNVSSKVNQAIIKSLILGHCGVEVSNLTVGFYLFFCISNHGIVNQLLTAPNGLRGLRVENSIQEICDNIAAVLDEDIGFLYNRKVVAIRNNKYNVEVQTEYETYWCGDNLNHINTHYKHLFGSTNNVVVTIPPPAIPLIKFFPPMPNSQRLILRNAVPGKLVKFIAIYNTAFWEERDCSGDVYVLNGHNAKRPLLCCFDLSTSGKPTLAGYTLFKGEKHLLLEQLSKYFGSAALQPVQFSIVQSRHGTPLCCYRSFEELNQVQKRHGRIFWAGAETSMEWFGSTCGAICAGQRTAYELLYDIRPSILTVDDMERFRTSMSSIRKKLQTYRNIFKTIVSNYKTATVTMISIIIIVIWKRNYIKDRITKMSIKN